VDVFFQDAIHLRQFEIISGATGDEYTVHGRPKTIALRTPAGSQQISLLDTRDVQRFDVDLAVPDGEPLRIVVLDRYDGTGGGNGVAITNLVFGASP
jgi:hypothetical protein